MAELDELHFWSTVVEAARQRRRVRSSPIVVPRILSVDAEEFHRAFENAMGPHNPYSAFVTHYAFDDLRAMQARLLASTHLAGIAVHDHGDGRIEGTALFNAGGRDGMGERLLRFAIDHEGVNYLECFGEGLRKLYERNGFVVESASPFNDEYAPPGWDYQTFSRPNYYTLRRVNVEFDNFKTPETEEEQRAAVDELLGDPARVHNALTSSLFHDQPGITQKELQTELALVEATLGF